MYWAPGAAACNGEEGRREGQLKPPAVRRALQDRCGCGRGRHHLLIISHRRGA